MNTPNFIIKSPCKINLGLKILDERKDGLHNILSIFIELTLFDTIEFIKSNKLDIKFKGANIPKNNTVSRAVDLISKYYNVDITHKIFITKKIPIGGGLGGGSGNGAYTLKALNQLYDLNISNKELNVLSQKIGSDVPFFIDGGIKKVEGKGNIITSIDYTEIKNKFQNYDTTTL